MKKMLTLSLTILTSCTLSLSAQTVPNGDFEEWTTLNGPTGVPYENPNGWTTSDQLNCTSPSAAKHDNAHSGSFGLRLETQNCALAGGSHEGFALRIFAYNSRPVYFTGWYKSERNVNDTGIIKVTFQRWDNVTNSRIAVGSAELKVSQNVSTYTSFSLPVDYAVSENPDTAYITMFSDEFDTRTVGNKLWIDKLAFSNTRVGLSDATPLKVAKVYPVPATSTISFDYALERSAKIKVIVMDITGRTVAMSEGYKSAGNNTTQIDIQDLKSGVYFYSIEAENHARTSGKFSKQ